MWKTALPEKLRVLEIWQLNFIWRFTCLQKPQHGCICKTFKINQHSFTICCLRSWEQHFVSCTPNQETLWSQEIIRHTTTKWNQAKSHSVSGHRFSSAKWSIILFTIKMLSSTQLILRVSMYGVAKNSFQWFIIV